MAKYLLDTHMLLWAAAGSLPSKAEEIIFDRKNDLFFSSASIWEIGIKKNLGRADFRVDPEVLCRELLDHGYIEIPINSRHTLMAAFLPPIHKDPFDRVLLSQARTEGIWLLTSDSMLLKYQGPVLYIE